MYLKLTVIGKTLNMLHFCNISFVNYLTKISFDYQGFEENPP